MPESRCPRCNGMTFEVKAHEPKGANRIVQFVQCAECGTVVGAVDYARSNLILHTLRKLAFGLGIDVDTGHLGSGPLSDATSPLAPGSTSTTRPLAQPTDE